MVGNPYLIALRQSCPFSGSWDGFGNLAEPFAGSRDLGLGIAVMTIVRSFSKAIWRES
jgi:hypothetical protein